MLAIDRSEKFDWRLDRLAVDDPIPSCFRHSTDEMQREESSTDCTKYPRWVSHGLMLDLEGKLRKGTEPKKVCARSLLTIDPNGGGCTLSSIGSKRRLTVVIVEMGQPD